MLDEGPKTSSVRTAFNHPEAAEIRSKFRSLRRETGPLAHGRVGAEVNELLSLAPSESVYDALFAALEKLPVLNLLYNQDARVPFLLTLKEHSRDALRQSDRYGLHRGVSEWIAPNSFRLFLLLHDIGKALPNDPIRQGHWTKLVLAGLKEPLAIAPHDFRIMQALLSNDSIGLCFSRLIKAYDLSVQAILDRHRDEHGRPDPAVARLHDPRYRFMELQKDGKLTKSHLLEYVRGARIIDRGALYSEVTCKVKAQVLQNADMSGLSPAAIFSVQRAFYQADSSSYSLEGRGGFGCINLEHLYLINPDFGYPPAGPPKPLFLMHEAEPRLAFSEKAEELYRHLLAAATSR